MKERYKYLESVGRSVCVPMTLLPLMFMNYSVMLRNEILILEFYLSISLQLLIQSFPVNCTTNF